MTRLANLHADVGEILLTEEEIAGQGRASSAPGSAPTTPAGG